MHSPIVGEIGCCPERMDWEARHKQFRRLEFAPHGPQATSMHLQIQPLIYELEHTYCAGAWIAALVLAHALVEVFLHSKGVGSREKWRSFLEPHGLDAEVQWLCKRRNSVLHMQDPKKPSIELDKVMFGRDSLYTDAKKAVAIAFRVVFLET